MTVKGVVHVEKKQTFGSRLKAMRKERGYSSAEALADAAGITRQSIGKYEKEERRPDIIVLRSLARALGVSSDYLLGLSEAKSPNETIQGIHKETGLSESSILVLQALKDCEDTGANITELLSALIVDTGQNMISTLSLIASASNALVILTRDPTYEQTLSGEVDVNGLYWKCQNVFTSFIKRYVKNMQGEES